MSKNQIDEKDLNYIGEISLSCSFIYKIVKNYNLPLFL